MLGTLAPSPTREEQVYARLRQAIIEGQLEPGQELVVTTVAEQLGVSRIPVMHACQRLIGEGFLMANPRRSAIVAPITEARIEEGAEVLTALECLALAHAARAISPSQVETLRSLNAAVRTFRREPGSLMMNQTDYRFHTALWELSGKPYLLQQLRMVYDHHEPARVLGRRYHEAGRSASEHDRIIAALEAHDAGAAQAALREHRARGMQRAIRALRDKQAGT